MDITMNYSNAQDHVPAAERNNRALKETFQTMLHRSGYSTIPRPMIIALGEYIAEYYNMFPARNSISEHYSANMLVAQKVLNYKKHCQYEFGTYVQAHHQNEPTNIMAEEAWMVFICTRIRTNKWDM